MASHRSVSHSGLEMNRLTIQRKTIFERQKG